MRLITARSLSPLSFLAIFALSLTQVAAVVVGIDLGTEYIKAALVGPGLPLDIVLTKDSKRKEAAALTFKPVKQKSSSDKGVFPERAYGGDAIALSARFPRDSFSNIKSLLGIPYSDDAVQRYSKRYPGVEIVEDRERGRVALQSATFEDGELPFLVEELLAMELQNVAANAEAMVKQKIKDAVITVPAYWTVDEKDAVRKSAELAGLNVLSLISDGLAVGIYYAREREFPVVNEPGKDNKPEYHVIYDMGAGGTTATVLKMQGRIVKDVGRFNKTIQEVQVAGVGWDQTLGGDAMNVLIMDDMIDQLSHTPKIKALGATKEQISMDGRTVSKLWKESERMRQVLSANSETQATFEGLYHEDVTFKYHIKRAEFENLAEDFSKRVRGPIDQALYSARLEWSDIESIVVHGGAQRTPFVQRTLEKYLGKAEKVRNNVNSDEAAVLGVGFWGASFNPGIRVNKEIRISDVSVHDVWISWNQDGKVKKQKVFTDTSVTGQIKSLPFKDTEDFSFEIYQNVLDGSNMRDVPVWTVKTTNLTKATKELMDKHGCTVENIKTQFDVWLNPSDSLPDVTRGTVSCEVIDDKKGGLVDGIKGFFGGKKDDQKVLNEDEATSTTTQAADSTASADTEKLDEPKKRQEIAFVGVMTDAAKRKKLSHMETFRVRDRLSAFQKSDKEREQRSEALNKLEGYTYRVRDLLENEAFIAVSNEKQRLEIEQTSKDASEWIYGDGSEAGKSDFEKRLKQLQELVTPIEARRAEASKRPGEIEILEKTLNSTRTMLDTLKASAQKVFQDGADAIKSAAASANSAVPSAKDDFADLEDESTTTGSSEQPVQTLSFKPEDFDPAYEKLELAQTWLKEKIAAQAKLSSSDEPALLVEDLKAKAKELGKITTDLLQKQLKMQAPDNEKKSKSSSSQPRGSKISKTKKPTSAGGDNSDVGKESGTTKPVEAKPSDKEEL